jgi:type IV secretory pathway VirB4 component
MLYTFIWKSSVNRVKKDIMQKEYQEGGLKMINIHSFILALRKEPSSLTKSLANFTPLLNHSG